MCEDEENLRLLTNHELFLLNGFLSVYKSFKFLPLYHYFPTAKTCTSATRTMERSCSKLTNKEDCLSSTDIWLTNEGKKVIFEGRVMWGDCVWCKGKACTDDNGNKCEPKNLMMINKGKKPFIDFDECL